MPRLVLTARCCGGSACERRWPYAAAGPWPPYPCPEPYGARALSGGGTRVPGASPSFASVGRDPALRAIRGSRSATCAPHSSPAFVRSSELSPRRYGPYAADHWTGPSAPHIGTPSAHTPWRMAWGDCGQPCWPMLMVRPSDHPEVRRSISCCAGVCSRCRLRGPARTRGPASPARANTCARSGRVHRNPPASAGLPHL
jgi:hypothetical protein